MELVLLDRAQQTGTANTTLSFTFTGDVLNFQSLVGLGNNKPTYYGASDGLGNWESGMGIYTTADAKLTRTEIFESSNNNLAVTFARECNIFVTLPNKKAVYLDENGKLSAPANLIKNVPSGSMTATNVQTAIDELDEKQELSALHEAARFIQTYTIMAQMASMGQA